MVRESASSEKVHNAEKRRTNYVTDFGFFGQDWTKTKRVTF